MTLEDMWKAVMRHSVLLTFTEYERRPHGQLDLPLPAGIMMEPLLFSGVNRDQVRNLGFYLCLAIKRQ